MRSSNSEIDRITIGEVIRPHGVRGAVFIKLLNADSDALVRAPHIWLQGPDGTEQSYQIIERQWMPKGWKLELADVESLEAAEALRGSVVWVERMALGPLSEDEFYVQDLVHCRVIDADAGEVGTLESIEPTPVAGTSSDRWWVKRPDGSTFGVPAVKRYIKSIDLTQRQIHIAGYAELL